jgi:hypothetical protein
VAAHLAHHDASWMSLSLLLLALVLAASLLWLR